MRREIDFGTHIRIETRTNIEIDDALMAEAMQRGGFRTKRAAVEEGLRLMVRLARQREALAALWGSEPDWQAPPEDAPRHAALHEDQAPPSAPATP